MYIVVDVDQRKIAVANGVDYVVEGVGGGWIEVVVRGGCQEPEGESEGLRGLQELEVTGGNWRGRAGGVCGYQSSKPGQYVVSLLNIYHLSLFEGKKKASFT